MDKLCYKWICLVLSFLLVYIYVFHKRGIDQVLKGKQKMESAAVERKPITDGERQKGGGGVKQEKLDGEKYDGQRSDSETRVKDVKDDGEVSSEAESKRLLLEWAAGLDGKARKVFSQNDEDGVIEAVFDKIGTTDRVYVEFGVENGEECNTRYLREEKQWDVMNSLLMDGGNNRPEINLMSEMFWPDNILELFEKYNVKKKFDFLSEAGAAA